MWHFISDHISEATGSLFLCQKQTAVGGGDAHNTFVIRDDSRRYFVKTSPIKKGTMLAYEKDALNRISKTGCIATPSVICIGETDSRNGSVEYLVLEYLKFRDPDANEWEQMGSRLARLHRNAVSPQYGWHEHNIIGTTPQKNTFSSSWSHFFADYRIGEMLEGLAHQGVKLTNIDIFVTQIQKLLSGHRPVPSLLHGDLWHGNVGFCKYGPVVFDPACYFGDREADIAKTELFGTFPHAFYLGYNREWPLEDAYLRRAKVYNLYHLLNHARMFGTSYIDVCKMKIEEIKKLA